MSGTKILLLIPSIEIDYFAKNRILNAFTPKRVCLNDTFIPKLRSITSFELEVVDSWGEVHFTANSLKNKGWDGICKDQLVPAGNFNNHITFTTLDGQSVNRTGGLTLIR